jgi:tetratricopeptide (TPR) repeat protein
MIPLSSYSQYRTFTHLYLFKAQQEGVTVKVYDLSQKCIAKCGFYDLSPEKLSMTDLSALVKKIHTKHPILSKIPLAGESDYIADTEQLISQVKPTILCDNEKLQEFCCPLTLQVFEDPVIDEHGDTFEKSAIEAHMKKNGKFSPLNRKPITADLKPNRALKAGIEELRRQDPIPTLALFKKSNPQLANNNLKHAQDCIEAKEYEEALSAYKNAFQFTRELTHFKGLILLFEKMGQKDRALLATLHLVLYQLQSGEHTLAIETLEKCRKDHPEFIQIYTLLIKLYRSVQENNKANSCTLYIGKVLSQKHPKDAILLYKDLIGHNPDQWTAYSALASLLQKPYEKAHILFMGACHAIRVGDYSMAEDFCCIAASCSIFADRLITLDVLTRQGKPTKDILLNIGTRSDNPSLKIKAYRMLLGLEDDPFYYREIIRNYYKIDKPQKAIQYSHNLLSLLIEKAEWEQAEKFALSLSVSSKKIPIYEQLETIYTHWNGDKLENLWLKLGKAYVDNQQLAQAERVYTQGFKRFGSFQSAINLADIFIRQSEKKQGVQHYYEASSIALSDRQLDRVRLCVTEINKNDPGMELLDLSQRKMLLAQSIMLELSDELKSTQQELLKLSDEIKVLKKTPSGKASKNATKPTCPPSSFSFAPSQPSPSQVNANKPATTAGSFSSPQPSTFQLPKPTTQSGKFSYSSSAQIPSFPPTYSFSLPKQAGSSNKK